MLNLIKNLISPPSENQTPETKIKKVQIATCALLLEMAKADGEFTKNEEKNIISLVKEKFQLPENEINELLEETKKELKSSLDLWQFTNQINKSYSREEKMEVIEMVWKVVYSDQKLDKHEDYLVHKLAELLNLSHRELINVKMKVKQN